MTWTLDRTTDRGKVRVLITGEAVEATAVFDDLDIDVFLGIDSNVLIAAALGLERIAGDHALLLRKVRNADNTADVLFGGAMKLEVGSIKLDSAGAAESFLRLAARYRAAAEGGEDDILIAEWVTNEATWGEAIWNDILRTSA